MTKPNAALMIFSGKPEKMPAPKKAPAKSTGPKKVRIIDMGSDKPPIKIKHPGALKAKASAAGEGTKEFAQTHDQGKGTTAKQSRAALGLMAMVPKKK